MMKEKLETHSELMLEPKSEYVEEMNEDSIEDLTLDDDDLSNMEQMDDGAGPSHGGEGSSQQGKNPFFTNRFSKERSFGFFLPIFAKPGYYFSRFQTN